MSFIGKLTGFSVDEPIVIMTPTSATNKRTSVLQKASGINRTQTQKNSVLKVLMKFQSVGILPNTLISEEFLYQKLELIAKCSKRSSLNRSVAEQLYAECPKYQKSQIFIEDFLLICFEGRRILKEKHDNIKSKQTELRIQQKHISALLQQNLREQAQNRFNIAKNSVLKLQILEASHLISPGFQTKSSIQRSPILPFVVIHCNGRNFRTTPPYIPDRINPKWNQSFEFPISIGNEELHIEVKIEEEESRSKIYNPSRLLGQLVIPVNALRDQLETDTWHPLYDSHNLPTQSQIHLVLRWIYDQVSFYQDAQARNQTEIDAVEIDLEDIIQDHDEIKFYLNEESIILPPTQLVIRRELSTVQQSKSSFSTAIAEIPSHLRNTIILSVVLVNFAMIQSVARTPFLDILVGLLIWVRIFADFYEKNNLFQILIAIAISCCYDLFWISVFYENWWEYAGTLDLYSESKSNILERITIIFVILAMFLKVWLAIEIWMCIEQFKVAESLQNEPYYYNFKVLNYSLVIRGKNTPKIKPPLKYQTHQSSHSATPTPTPRSQIISQPLVFPQEQQEQQIQLELHQQQQLQQQQQQQQINLIGGQNHDQPSSQQFYNDNIIGTSEKVENEGEERIHTFEGDKQNSIIPIILPLNLNGLQ